MSTPYKSSAAVACLLLMSLGVAGCGSDAAPAAPVAPLPEVSVYTIKAQSTELSVILPGRAAAYRIAEVRPQVTGIVQKRLFEEGQMLSAGDPLYQIDEAPYRAQYESARAALARAQATATAASSREQRFAELVKVNGVSQQDYDDAYAALKQAEADIASARAAFTSARIDLEHTTIHAPIEGRIGRSQVTDGALVTANQAGEMATIRALDPIYVDVTQSSAEILRWKRKMQDGQLAMIGDDQLRVSLELEDGKAYEHAGKLELAEVNVDPTTGTVTLRAVFPNPHNILLPGMFVRANIMEGRQDDAIIVPQAAISRSPQGDGLAYVVNGDSIVEQRIVTTERALGDKWLVSEGLKEGDQIITEGFQRFRPGAAVKALDIASNASTPAAGGAR